MKHVTRLPLLFSVLRKIVLKGGRGEGANLGGVISFGQIAHYKYISYMYLIFCEFDFQFFIKLKNILNKKKKFMKV